MLERRNYGFELTIKKEREKIEGEKQRKREREGGRE